MSELYAVGDPDPTGRVLASEYCDAIRDEYVCTWPKGHEHPQHIAGDSEQVCAAWPVARWVDLCGIDPDFPATPADPRVAELEAEVARLRAPSGEGAWWGSEDCHERECEDFGDADSGMGLDPDDESAWPCSHVVWVPARIEAWIREAERDAARAAPAALRERLGSLAKWQERDGTLVMSAAAVQAALLAATPSETEAGL